jgi:hypothetical protein
MALEPQQIIAADVLAVRILLGQLIVRIAARQPGPGLSAQGAAGWRRRHG